MFEAIKTMKPVERLFSVMSLCAVVPLYFEDTRQVLGLIFIAIMSYLFFRKDKPKTYSFHRYEKWWLWSAVIYAVVFILSFLLRPPYTDDGSWRIAAPIFILLLSVWYFLAIRYDVQAKLIKFVAIASVVTATALFVIEVLVIHWPLGYRLGLVYSDLGATGFIVPITAIMLAVLWLSDRSNKYLWLFIVGFILASLSGGRTSMSLVVIPIVFVLYYVLFFSSLFTKQQKTILLMLSIIFISLAAWFAKDKLVETVSDYQIAQQGEFYSSLGLRYAMNDIGLSVFQNNSLVGVGPSEYKESLKAESENSNYSTQVKDSIQGFMQIHNQYLMDMILSGWFGLLSVLGFIFLPAVIFLCLLKRNQQSLALRAALGLSVAIGFIQLFGANFTYTYTTIFYVMAMGSLISFLSKKQESLQ
ncbi:O-antigen ligase family protein [Thiomicrorhabdus sediminis]|uniref:O-antigen ligase-related domain-containing protein n=1 Tax=Thiomicrorhabdus sediminis TaxID=2580412 RepID=A0A4P9K6L1_9GAMM|nr:O-antigen ligase family protein [Thiomicrorhabdus sediminis]QCU90702.1 hypothetical protein FE785_08705 [Thiomicrorhabdus sediminis]